MCANSPDAAWRWLGRLRATQCRHSRTRILSADVARARNVDVGIEWISVGKAQVALRRLREYRLVGIRFAATRKIMQVSNKVRELIAARRPGHSLDAPLDRKSVV